MRAGVHVPTKLVTFAASSSVSCWWRVFHNIRAFSTEYKTLFRLPFPSFSRRISEKNFSLIGDFCCQSRPHLCVFMYTVLTFLLVSRLGLSHWDPYAMRRGGCLELYYCNMVEWCWWDSSLICKTNWFPVVLWHCWFGRMTHKIVPDMTYNVFGGTLNLLYQSLVTVLLLYRHSDYSKIAVVRLCSKIDHVT